MRFGIGPQMVVILLVVGLAGAMAIEPTRRLLEQRRRIAEIAQDLRSTRRSNERLEATIERLNDPDYLEQEARRFGLVRRGETAYVVVPPSRKARNRRSPRHGDDRPEAAEPSFLDAFVHFVGLR